MQRLRKLTKTEITCLRKAPTVMLANTAGGNRKINQFETFIVHNNENEHPFLRFSKTCGEHSKKGTEIVDILCSNF